MQYIDRYTLSMLQKLEAQRPEFSYCSAVNIVYP